MSLVLVSPSTESWFQVRAAAGRSRPHSTAGSTAASVRMTDSIVAMFGWIIPTPLAMPLTVTAHARTAVRSGQVHGRGGDLRDRIGRPQGDGRRLEAGVVGRELRHQRLEARGDLVERQARADDAGREVEDVRLVDAERLRDQPPDLRLVGVAGRAGRGIGAAARRDDGLGPAESAARIAGRGARGWPATGERARPRTRSG